MQRIASCFAKGSRIFVVPLKLLTDNRVDGQCVYRVEKARRFLSESRFPKSADGRR